MRSLDPLDGIAVFLAVAETLNFSQAAERLDMSRATVSAQIATLERRLGVRLLQRDTRNVLLSEAGMAYRQALAGVLPQVREAERAALSFHQEAIGRLKISAPPDLGQEHLAPLIADFLARNSAVAIDLDLSHGAVNVVEEGYDLAIRGALAVEPNLVTRQIGTSSIQPCASPDYLARRGAPERPEDLAAHACLHFAPLRWGRMWPLRREEETVRVPILPTLDVNDGLVLRAAARAGAGIALLPAFIAGEDLRAGRLVPVLPDWSVAAIPIHAVYPANRHIAVKVRSFVQFLVTRLSGHPDFKA